MDIFGDCTDTDLSRKMEKLNGSLAYSGDDTVDNNGNRSPASDLQSDNTSEDSQLTLTDLPTEVLFHITSFLESRVIIVSLCRACKLFYQLFSNDSYWRSRISQRWPKQYPVIEREKFNWRRACMKREEIHDMWSKPDEHFHHFMVKEGFFAAVDVVHLMKEGQFLAVGSRDRHLNILDLTKYTSETRDQIKDLIVASETKAHKGWVWSMASHGNSLVTGSWDTHIRMWDFNSGEITASTDVKLKSAILGLYYEPNFIAAGGFDKRLYMFDPRAPNEYIRKHYHSQPILSVAGDDKYIITSSEDKVISVYDRVAGKNFKKMEVENFVLSLSYGDGQLWFGDKVGKLHVMDARDGLFDEEDIKTMEIDHNGRLTSVVHTDGGIFTCSSDSQIKVVEPSLQPGVINTLKVHSGEVARISYQNGVLASAGADISVGVWLPKNRKY